MPTYAVIRRADQAEVYRYTADQAVEWAGFEFATHEHVAVLEPAPPAPPALVLEWHPLEFQRRFSPAERIAIRQARTTDAVLHDFFSLLEQAPTVHSNDPDMVAGVNYLVAAGYLTAARRDAIMGGA